MQDKGVIQFFIEIIGALLHTQIVQVVGDELLVEGGELVGDSRYAIDLMSFLPRPGK